ncbi:MAG: alpha-E domain-containing protein, partial [Fimbriimonadaceae bacterium]|nr:alpha-E domain-containing protein [Alphaproteobacteria bacterium]
RMPRSLAFCYAQIHYTLNYLAEDYGEKHSCHTQAENVLARLGESSIGSIIETGLHEFIEDFLRDNTALGGQIEKDYLFYG